ncbi:MAG: triphosphoribosyl-dephospho-CoA synthase [Acidaminococcales bacterium]|nr:triphosphoribosyl-dephospho-CoA synthase [Acidaminococcales bacterium]
MNDSLASADASPAGREALEKMGRFLTQAIFLEVSVHPKPGLVTRFGNGAHRDMSILTFAMSSAVLSKSFYDLLAMGAAHEGALPQLFAKARRYGELSERELLESTKNVNTQRGILFSGGILSLAAGVMLKDNITASVENICQSVRALTAGLVERELCCLAAKRRLTVGELLFKKHKITGIRGEVEKGFPSVAATGLPALREAFGRGADLNDALAHTLLALMTVVEDSNVVWRSGYGKLPYVQAAASSILEAGSVFTGCGRSLLDRTAAKFAKDRISPGGSADLLAITVALYLLENRQFPVAII